MFKFPGKVSPKRISRKQYPPEMQPKAKRIPCEINNEVRHRPNVSNSMPRGILRVRRKEAEHERDVQPDGNEKKVQLEVSSKHSLTSNDHQNGIFGRLDGRIVKQLSMK